jgi:GNAT superfamily N-acetyltransferase
VQAWAESYRGLVPDAMIEALSVERNARMWMAILDRGEKSVVHVVEADADIVGFGSAGEALSDGLGAAAEVTSLYLLDRVKRRGIGRALLTSLLRALAGCGHASAGLWVLAGNEPTRRFYEALGGRAGETRIVEGSHGEMHEVAYVWDDLARFTRAGSGAGTLRSGTFGAA